MSVSRILGAILASLVVLQGGMATLDLSSELRAGASLAVSVVIAGLAFYLGKPTVE